MPFCAQRWRGLNETNDSHNYYLRYFCYFFASSLHRAFFCVWWGGGRCRELIGYTLPPGMDEGHLAVQAF